MNIKKKIVASIIGLSLVVMMAPGVAQGATIEELEAQIADLLAQITTLQTQLAALTGTGAGAPAACAGITFTANLSMGSSGNDVKCLQALLNQSAATQLAAAASDAGSPGNETIYFGPLTQAAVIKFQEKYASEVLTPIGLTAGTGFVGSMTRAKLNALLTAAEEEEEEEEEEEVGGEGTLAATAAATPADAQTIYVGQTKVAVAGVNVKALGSDIKLTRIDVTFTSRPWLNISTITITDGTTDVLSYDVTEANTIEVIAGSSYLVRITNLNITIPDGTTKTLTVKVDPELVAGTTSANITYQIPANGLRGTDGVGIQQYAPSTALTARSFAVGTATGDVALSVNASNPVERAVIGSASVITENVELLRLDLKATVNEVLVSRIQGTLVDEATAAGAALQTLTLYDGDTALAATSTSAGSQTIVFTPLDIRISKDVTKTLSVKGTMNIVTAARQNASSSLSVVTGGVTAADAGTYAGLTVSGATANGKKIHVYTAAPSLKLVSTSIATNKEGRLEGSPTISADAKIKFEVTALGGDIYVGSTTGNAITATTTTSVSGISIDPMTKCIWLALSGVLLQLVSLLIPGIGLTFRLTSGPLMSTCKLRTNLVFNFPVKA